MNGLDDAAVNAAIAAAIRAVIGDSFAAKPKQAMRLLNVSPSTYYRGVGSGVIETVPRGDGHAVTSPVLHRLMKYGIPSMTEELRRLKTKSRPRRTASSLFLTVLG
jgi:hypothetical protein